jgi:hypothetical protein
MSPNPAAEWAKLEEFLSRQNPLTLLSQLALTFLFVPAGEFQGELSGGAEWERRIEFLAGYLLARPLPAGQFSPVDGATLETAQRLLDDYYSAVRLHLLSSLRDQIGPSAEDSILLNSRAYAMYVRGEAYPHQFEEFAVDLYSPHDAWFRQNLGFTIGEAVGLSAAIRREYEKRNWDSKNRARQEARIRADELVAVGQVDDASRKDVEVAVGCSLHFGNAENLLAFTVEELAGCSGLPLEVCRAFVHRLSQDFGYHNPQFPNTFIDAFTAPWDYNTLGERPLVTLKGRYWVPVVAVLRQALLSTFYFDLMADTAYRATFEQARGAFVETKTAEYLRRVFPSDEVLLNPCRPNGNEFADVVVLHDGKVLIVQCKSKPLTRPAKIGADLEALKTDLRKAVQDAFKQGVAARNYLSSTCTPKIAVADRVLDIDMSQVSAVYILNVTLTPFQMLTTRLANCNPILSLFTDEDYPWSMAIGDLDILTQVLGSPSSFIHYATRRLQLERTPFDVFADEMDLLGFYLSQGMYFDTPEFQTMNGVSIVGLSSHVDRWVFERHEMGKAAQPPKPPMPAGFEEFIIDIEQSNAMHRTNCTMGLLDLSGMGRKGFIQMVNLAKEKTRYDRELHSSSMTVVGNKRGLSFVSLDAGGDRQKIFQAAASFAMLKKYQEKAPEWIGLGWDVASSRSVDAVFYAKYEWVPDKEMERLAQSHLKPGIEVDP